VQGVLFFAVKHLHLFIGWPPSREAAMSDYYWSERHAVLVVEF
jgi:hypothetical protein